MYHIYIYIYIYYILPYYICIPYTTSSHEELAEKERKRSHFGTGYRNSCTQHLKGTGGGSLAEK